MCTYIYIHIYSKCRPYCVDIAAQKKFAKIDSNIRTVLLIAQINHLKMNIVKN